MSQGPRPPAEAGDRYERLMALLGPIHDRARRTARRLCRSHADGDDLFQEAALRAAERLDGLRDAARFPGWFYAVLLSVHRARARRAFWRRFLPLGAAPEPPPPPPEDERRLRAARVAEALAALPAPQREALVLFEVDGFTIEEIAQMQGDSVSAVKTRLSRGRRRLRARYEALGTQEEPAPVAAPLRRGGHG